MNVLPQLEKFIDLGIQHAMRAKYTPAEFIRMRNTYGTVEAIKRLVISGDIQSGFLKMQKLGMLEWTIEQAVLNFPNLFDKAHRNAAAWRIRQARNSALQNCSQGGLCPFSQ